MTLILDLEGKFVVFGDALGWAKLLFCSQEGVVWGETKEAAWEGDCVFEVGLHFDLS